MTHLQRNVQFPSVGTVIQLDRHNSDFDGAAWSVRRSVRLNEGRDIPVAEGDVGRVGKDDPVVLVAPNVQLQEGVVWYGARKLE